MKLPTLSMQARSKSRPMIYTVIYESSTKHNASRSGEAHDRGLKRGQVFAETPVFCSLVLPIIMSSPVVEVQLGPTYGAQLLVTFLSVALWGTASMQT